MSFWASAFLWTLSGLTIPILIALWNRRRLKRENFGGFYLLRKIYETTQRRIRLLELLKLINRIFLFALLILLFAEPLNRRVVVAPAENGFVIFLDSGRAMQLSDDQGISLIDRQRERLMKLLDQMPAQSQGMIFFVSDRCDSWTLSDGRSSARATEWKDAWDENSLAYSAYPTTSAALSQCATRGQKLFQGRDVFTALISPLPSSLDPKVIRDAGIRVEVLPQPELKRPLISQLELRQEWLEGRIRVSVHPADQKKEARLIYPDREEALGAVGDSLDLLPQEQSWLHLQASESPLDPWSNQKIVPLEFRSSQKLVVWAQKESPGFVSLLTALRNHPDLQVIRQLGGEPTGEAIIIYGSFQQSLQNLSHAWFFVPFEGVSPYTQRDQKHWSSEDLSSDIRRSFTLPTQDGEVFVRRYVILDLDQFETLETFADGAPALLKDRLHSGLIWVSPFDLEDLTTDLTLEASFIPYLYRRLDRWLHPPEVSSGDKRLMKPIWLMPGRVKPSPLTVARLDWPGIYAGDTSSKIIEPGPIPGGFLEWENPEDNQLLKEEEISLKPQIIQWLSWSFLLELIFCLMGILWIRRILKLAVFLFALGLSGLGSPLGAQAVLRKIPLGHWTQIDGDRLQALRQLGEEMAPLSNLEFDEPSPVQIQGLWKYPLVVVSSTQPWGPFSKEDRELIRDYLERGGLLLFDDPLALEKSRFYHSVASELSQIFPGRSLQRIDKQDVIFRTFYLLNEVSGRKLAVPSIEGLNLDRRWVAIFSFNDLLGAILRSKRGDYALPVSPYGFSQRTLALRLLLNFFMYGVTIDYKDDAIHLPHILSRRLR